MAGRRSRTYFAPIAVAVAVLLGARGARGTDVLVSWRPVTGAAGYRIYTREPGRSYGAGLDVGPASSVSGIVQYRLPGVSLDRTCYFAVGSYNAAGTRSALSNELSLCTIAAGGLMVTEGRLVRDSARNRDNGRLRIRGVIDDSAGGTALEGDATQGRLGFSIRDGSAFAVTFDLSSCRAGSSFRCTSADGRARGRLRPVRGGPVYKLSLDAHKLSRAETGGTLPASPLSITLHAASTADRLGTIATCTGAGERALVCRRP